MGKIYYQRVGEEGVVYEACSKLAHSMNSPMREVFERHATCSVEQLASELYPNLEPEDALRLVENALEELVEAGLVTGRPRSSPRGSSRREFLAGLGKTAVVVPILTSCLIPEPAAAQSVTCPTTTFAVFPNGDENTGSPATPVISNITSQICIGSSATKVELVATNSNSMISGNPTGLEFDEDVTFSVTSPSSTTNSIAYGSFEMCALTRTMVTAGSASLDITALFQTGGAELSSLEITNSRSPSVTPVDAPR